jgi:hypothetical protein
MQTNDILRRYHLVRINMDFLDADYYTVDFISAD